MTITDYFLDDADQIVGERRACNMGASGWPDVLTFQRDRLAHYKEHPRERADLTPTGINVIERSPSMGLRRVLEIALW